VLPAPEGGEGGEQEGQREKPLQEKGTKNSNRHSGLERWMPTLSGRPMGTHGLRLGVVTAAEEPFGDVGDAGEAVGAEEAKDATPRRTA